MKFGTKGILLRFRNSNEVENKMTKFLMVVPMITALGACAPGGGFTKQQGALTGAALGAAAGAAVSNDDDQVVGALVDGAAGAAAGNYLGRSASGQCVYQNSAGQRYTAACP